ncbi:DUF1285 domain-containing protein [Lacimicrobium alkaliphilum]|uniref:Proteophosphoglycan n=1 Tax=Lacimicrobium alkaliphilum TaxID=1526571 RepID=A0ABQ1RKS4_9ALTE|nr:DUF1285 domain-containing protein [Lacimicrobium alkaliphilum]GGD71509.1 hypothetical protein GCM10011357_28190 [Lacimicrobium alkaliphilum]
MKLEQIQKQLATADEKLPPVDKWDPPYCGEMDITIKHDGSWHYMGSPIGRQALVRLFAGVLKKERDRYFLVTPVEKVAIEVEDVPFVITNWRKEEDKLVFTSNIGDSFIVSREHPVELQQDRVNGDLLPYALVRRNLYGRLHQNLFYQLVDLGQPQQQQGKTHLMLHSGDYPFSLGLL